VRFAILGSGSEGNGLVVEAAAVVSGGRPTRILVDCGFGIRETVRRLERAGLVPADLDAIVLTHEHDDHASGAFKFGRRYDIPVWLTAGTLRGSKSYLCEGVVTRIFDSHTPFSIGALKLNPFTVPHDACEPTQFVFGDGVQLLGLLTDAGRPTSHIVDSLHGVNALILECNHDIQMLAASSYPASLKRRIGGEYGHLSNAAAAAILAAIDQSNLQHVVAAHLSQSNNTARHARDALSAALVLKREVEVACQFEGLSWRNIVN
jgi:phosphoribosyl 1,2-cyclic phosphodiesterase